MPQRSLSSRADSGRRSLRGGALSRRVRHGVPSLRSTVWGVASFYGVFRRGARHRRSLTDVEVLSLIVVFAYLVSSVFGVTMFYTAPYLFLFLGLGYCCTGKKTA